MFPWWKDANKDFMITFGFQLKILGQVSLIILINGFCINEKYLIGKWVPEQKLQEKTSQNCNLIGYLTHLASNFIIRGIKKFHRKVMFIIFTKITHNLTITIHKHIDHI